jgi:hypothetical protein
MRAVDPIGSRGKSMVQTALPVGRYAARTFRVAQTAISGKAVQSRQTSAILLEHSAGEPPEYLVMPEPRDFAGSLNRFPSRGFAP